MTCSNLTIHQHSKNSSQLLSYEQKDLSKRKFVFKVLKDSTIALEAHILHFKKLQNVASINLPLNSLTLFIRLYIDLFINVGNVDFYFWCVLAGNLRNGQRTCHSKAFLFRLVLRSCVSLFVPFVGFLKCFLFGNRFVLILFRQLQKKYQNLILT